MSRFSNKIPKIAIALVVSLLMLFCGLATSQSGKITNVTLSLKDDYTGRIVIKNGTLIATGIEIIAPVGNVELVEVDVVDKSSDGTKLQAADSSLHMSGNVGFYKDEEKTEKQIVRIPVTTHVVIEKHAKVVLGAIEPIAVDNAPIDTKLTIDIKSEETETIKVNGLADVTSVKEGQVEIYHVYTEDKDEKTYYGSIQDAVNEIETSGVIYIDEDINGDGIVVDGGKEITIDFQGHVYEITGKLVGSSGTETLGMQLLKGTTVTLRNGTLKSSKAKMLVQNYSDLTLKDMELDGSQIDGTYTLSNNYGTTNIVGSKIIAKDGCVAFDVWYGMLADGSYDDGLTVNVDEDSEIVGKVEYGAKRYVQGWLSKTELNVEDGAKWSETITLSKDITIDEPWRIGSSVTIGLNGKTIKAVDGYSDWYIIIASGEGVELEITGNGTIDANASTGSNGIPVTSANGAKVTIKDGTYKCVGESECVYANGGIVAIYGGEYKVCDGETVKDLLNVQNTHEVSDIQVYVWRIRERI